MNTKNVLIGLGVVVLLVLGLIFPRSGGTVVERIVGASPGPDISSPYLAVSGVEQWYYSAKFNNASTTICSFTAPSATSTLSFGSVNIHTATSSAFILEIAKSVKNSEATTTKLANTISVPASQKITLVASTTSAVLAGDMVFGPSERLNVKVAWTPVVTQTVNSLGGDCKAIFTKN